MKSISNVDDVSVKVWDQRVLCPAADGLGYMLRQKIDGRDTCDLMTNWIFWKSYLYRWAVTLANVATYDVVFHCYMMPSIPTTLHATRLTLR